MRTATEIGSLLVEVGRLLRARWWLLGFWFCLGWALHQIGLYGAARLGVGHAVLANLCFVLAVVIKLCSLVLMVHCLKPELRIGQGRQTDVDGFSIPPQVFAVERPIDVTALAVGPFLAVYAVWGFIDDEVRDLFVSNYTVLGLSDVSTWSISLDRSRLTFYLGLAVAGWLARQLLGLLLRRRPNPVLAVLGVLAEGLWTFASFVVVIIAFGKIIKPWLQTRTVWVEVTAGWRDFLQALPDWTLFFGTRLADLVQTVVAVLPGAISTTIALPLLWLALTATVYGWREFRAVDIAVGTRASARVSRWSDRPSTVLQRTGLFLTSDLRTKYLPVLQAGRLMLRAGPRFVGGYLLLATCLTSVDSLARIGLTVALGPLPLSTSVLIDPLQRLLVDAVIMVCAVALYAAGFDRALADATADARADVAANTAPDRQREKATTSAPPRTEIQTES